MIGSTLLSLFSLVRVNVTRIIISTEDKLPTQSHQRGTSDPSRMNLNETLRSIQQSIEKLVRDVEDLKKGKSSATMEQRVGDNLGGFNSPHNQRPYDNVSNYGYHDMPVKNSHPFHEGGYQGRPLVRGGRKGSLGGRGYYRPQEQYPRHEAWHDDNLYEDYVANLNVGQAYHGGYYCNEQGDKTLDKIKWKVPSFKGESDPNHQIDLVLGRMLQNRPAHRNPLEETKELRRKVEELLSKAITLLSLLCKPKFLVLRCLKNDLGKDLDPIQQPKEDSYHYQRTYENVPPYGYNDMPVQNSYSFHVGEYQGR
ncbi:hypothetical protein M9H77_30149 [Catharanthus roseus]|uniref:Uncharacterized protein n=1 Tax=Catharanthus roseus TaxID=4058 RepID=A0ACB9ZWG1_CATRO|nr:hypothetical protein M9H77_30149 [Catharanthus roseus]